jgi:lysophospholipase L1-like esterase
MKHLRRHFLAWAACAAVLLTVGVCAAAEEPARLPASKAGELYEQISKLMEAGTVAVPELSRAAAPLIENVRQSARALQVGATREHSGVLYQLLTNAKIYLHIADAVPKPPAFAADARKQLDSLREAVDRADSHFRATLEDKEQRSRGADRDNLARYQEENRLLSPPSPEEQRVVFFGDSITDGWPLNQYFPGKPYVNRGISGQITGEMIGRMKADVIDLKPKAMVILAGTNDLARGVPVSTIQNNLAMIGALAEQAGIKPVFASILPVSDYHKEVDPNYERTPGRPPEKIRELNTWLARMCESLGFRYLDYFSATVDDNGQLRADLAEDGLHPNAEGYKIMAPLAQTAIEAELRAAPDTSRRKRFGIF